MADPEITVEVVVPETTPEPETSGAPDVVVVETAPTSGGTDPAAILSMEMLFAQVTEARAQIDSLKSRVDFLNEWQSSQSRRIAELETVEESSTEIVAEVIPAAVVETVAEVQPVARKRKFI